MKLKQIAAILVLVLLFSLAAGCAGQADLTGAWSAPIDMSLLGVSVPNDDGTPLFGVLSYAFLEDGTGEMVATFNSIPISSELFQYTVEDDLLTLNCDSGTVLIYTYNIKKDILYLDGRVKLDLQRVS